MTPPTSGSGEPVSSGQSSDLTTFTGTYSTPSITEPTTVSSAQQVKVPSPGNYRGEKPVTKASVAGKLGETIVEIFAWSIKASFVLSFFILLASGGSVTTSTNEDGVKRTVYGYDAQTIANSFEVFKTVSSVMAGPLGFVLGFYFRESGNEI